MRITQTAKSDSVLLERMKDYTFSDEDRRLFTHRWPKGIAISRRGRLGALERWMQYKNHEIRAAPDRKKPCLITEKTIETWNRTIGRLHEQTTPSLAATKLFDGNRSTLSPDTVTYHASIFCMVRCCNITSRPVVLRVPCYAILAHQHHPAISWYHTSRLSPRSPCYHLNLVAAWDRSLRTLRRYIRRLPVSQLEWKLIHIAPINSYRLPGSSVKCGALFRKCIPGGGTAEDDEWLGLLDQTRLNVPYAFGVQIHCEPALMVLACSPSGKLAKTAGLEEVMEHMHDTIDVSKKCCCGCFLLSKILNDKKERQFKLCGTHGRISPWMPPAGLDVDVLLALKARFTQMLKQVIKSKQQTSLEEKHAHSE